MIARLIAAVSTLWLAGAALGQSPIVCTPEPGSGTPIASIWPAPYLSAGGSLCFDVKGWPEYSGQNCVNDGGRAAWTGLVIVMVDGESEGRDSTRFRVNNAVVRNERLEYVIEWSRGGAWKPMQHVKINRLTGQAVSHFVKSHGGDSYRCRLESRKI